MIRCRRVLWWRACLDPQGCTVYSHLCLSFVFAASYVQAFLTACREAFPRSVSNSTGKRCAPPLGEGRLWRAGGCSGVRFCVRARLSACVAPAQTSCLAVQSNIWLLCAVEALNGPPDEDYWWSSLLFWLSALSQQKRTSTNADPPNVSQRCKAAHRGYDWKAFILPWSLCLGKLSRLLFRLVSSSLTFPLKVCAILMGAASWINKHIFFSTIESNLAKWMPATSAFPIPPLLFNKPSQRMEEQRGVASSLFPLSVYLSAYSYLVSPPVFMPHFHQGQLSCSCCLFIWSVFRQEYIWLMLHLILGWFHFCIFFYFFTFPWHKQGGAGSSHQIGWSFLL